MGKRIISQARGHGSIVYRVRRQGYKYRIGYPNVKLSPEATGEIVKIVHSPAHSSPLLKIRLDSNGKSIIFYNLAFNNAFEGQKIGFEKEREVKEGDIIKLNSTEVGMNVYNIESMPGDQGKFIRTAGSSAQVVRKNPDRVFLMMPSKKEIKLSPECRATIGVIAAGGKVDKPFVKAGNRFHAMKARGKKWHFTSSIKMNSVDHPFGGGRGKRIKSKIAKRNAPPGAKVGHLRPRRTGHKK